MSRSGEDEVQLIQHSSCRKLKLAEMGTGNGTARYLIYVRKYIIINLWNRSETELLGLFGYADRMTKDISSTSVRRYNVMFLLEVYGFKP